MTAETKSNRGEVIRVATNTLAYLALDDKKTILSFTPSDVKDSGHRDFAELKIMQGSVFNVSWQPVAGRIESAEYVAGQKLNERSAFRADDVPDENYANLPRPEIARIEGPTQLVLRPDAAEKGRTVVRRAISPEVRTFGKIVDTSKLRPGDLMLSQDLEADTISKLITSVQAEGGYAGADARWTHAAMYLGDGENIVEATFESLSSGGSVRMTSLDDYCHGNYVLRFRRSKYIDGAEAGFRLCIRALSRIRQPYDFIQAARLWWDVRIRKNTLNAGNNRRTAAEAVICSTLYAEAYDEALRRRLGEIGGVCVPAWLSVSDEFDDVDVGWLCF